MHIKLTCEYITSFPEASKPRDIPVKVVLPTTLE